MLRFQELLPETIDLIKTMYYDRIIEKHEGPERWEIMVDHYNLEFIEVEGRAVLLPVDQEHHPQITILRAMIEQNEQTMTLFFKDRTFAFESEPEHFTTGFVAVCEKFPSEPFYITILYHEWFIIDEHTQKMTV